MSVFVPESIVETFQIDKLELQRLVENYINKEEKLEFFYPLMSWASDSFIHIPKLGGLIFTLSYREFIYVKTNKNLWLFKRKQSLFQAKLNKIELLDKYDIPNSSDFLLFKRSSKISDLRVSLKKNGNFIKAITFRELSNDWVKNIISN